MVKIQISYENEIEKLKVLEALKKVKIKNISKSFKNGKFYRVYVDIE